MKKLILIKLFAFLILLYGCTNPFSTREPEEPIPGSGVTDGGELQTNRDSLLAKIKIAFDTKDPQLYTECFADSFRIGTAFSFTPEADDAARLINWSLIDETTYFNNLVNEDALQKVVFEDSVLATFETSPDTFQAEFRYTIRVNFLTQSERYEGRSILRLVKAADELWYIFEWSDLKVSAANIDGTWSTLKANYRN